MSRIANYPVTITPDVSVHINSNVLEVKGKLGEAKLHIHETVTIKNEDSQLVFTTNNDSAMAKAMSGTTRALVNNMVYGVTHGFQKKLLLVGVGYRAQLKGSNILNLTLGFSHPVDYVLPEGISVDLPNQTEIIVKGTDKQKVGQVAAEIRSFRPPEPYKGKGVRYADETIILKETKKK